MNKQKRVAIVTLFFYSIIHNRFNKWWNKKSWIFLFQTEELVLNVK